MVLLALVPGLPKPPFLIVGALMLALAYRTRQAENSDDVDLDVLRRLVAIAWSREDDPEP